MNNHRRVLVTSVSAFIAAALLVTLSAQPPVSPLEALVRRGMERTHAQGLAIAVVDEGQVTTVATWGRRNAKGDPLTRDTVMYGASLTKSVFAYTIAQLAEEGTIDLDRSIADYLPRPLPHYTDAEDKYSAWQGLAGDERWRALTPRLLLNHSSGFANFYFLEPDGRLRIHFAPGTRYSYSGDGIILLQFVLERGLGLDVGREMQRRVFDRFGMANTSMMWRPDFAGNLADGWRLDGQVEPHDERSTVRAAGSMDTTIADFAKFAAAFMRGDGLSPKARADMIRPHLPIRTASQFPVLQQDAPAARQIAGLAAGLGLIVFDGPQGRGFQKGGHNDSTGNTWVCLEQRKRCVVILSNDVRAEPLFPGIVKLVLGDTGMPWHWEYGDVEWARDRARD